MLPTILPIFSVAGIPLAFTRVAAAYSFDEVVGCLGCLPCVAGLHRATLGASKGRAEVSRFFWDKFGDRMQADDS